ncbi:hypothetical protein [Edaphovirga cremea]|uniref:hypothetical protein n=1 Tax=Edaphovirga cremea TaxID=2267246 RepID=UPI003989E9FB
MAGVDIKNRLKDLVSSDREIIKDYTIGEHKVTKAQYDEWVTASLERQKELEILWNISWRVGQVKTSEPTVADSIAATLAQRGSRYGDFTDHARVCQSLKSCAIMAMPANSGRGFENLDDVAKQAVEVIFDKIARILTGDPNYDDNWHDIGGYARLVELRLPCNQNKEEK